MPRQIPTPSVSNLRSAAQAVRAAISGMTGAVADAFTALAGGLDQAQTAIETLEGKNRELGSPDARDPRANSTAYVSGDRIINGIQVQGGLATNAGQGLDLTFESQTGTIASKDHKDNSLLALVIQGSTISFTGTISLGTPLSVASGGTGLATLTAHALYVGNGTTAPVALGLGTTATVLHGNAAGDPTWGAVALATEVSGTLPVANGGTGSATGGLTATTQVTLDGGAAYNHLRFASTGGGAFLGELEWYNAGAFQAAIVADPSGVLSLFARANGGAPYLMLGPSASSGVRLAGIPTSAAGLSAGDIWCDTGAGNVLKMV